MVYYIIFGILLIITLMIETNEKKYWHLESLMIILTLILLVFFAGFRYNTGFDYSSYETIYRQIVWDGMSFGETINSGLTEPAYSILNWFISSSFKVFVFIIALLGIVPKMMYYYKLEHHRFFCVWLYFASIFVFYDMGVIRQGIAIGILYYSIRYIKERKAKKFWVLVIIAAMFHLTALMFIPLYYLGNRRFSSKIYYGVSIIALFLSTGIVRGIMLKMVAYIPSPYVVYKLNYYLNQSSANMMTSIIKRILVLVLFIVFFERKANKNDDVWLYVNGYTLSILFTGMFSFVEIIGGRGTAALYYLQIFVFAELLYKCKKRDKRILILGVVAVLFLSTMRGVVNASSVTPYIPYQNWFFEWMIS